MLRPARSADLPVLPGIERAAGELFRTLDMDLVADDPPRPAEELRPYREAGRCWVVDEDGVIGGYLLADLVDGCAHVEQVSVAPSHAGRGLGAALVDHLAGWAGARGLPALTLTTYRDVPWNGPYYRRLGFDRLDDGCLSPGLRRLRAEEIARGLDRWPRDCMRRPVRRA